MAGTGGAAAPAAATTARIYSYVEQSCYDAEDNLRNGRQPVTFRLFSVGRPGAALLGGRLEASFTSDYAVYYGGDDEYLVASLEQAAPHVPWRTLDLVYHRWLDQSRIQILCAATGKIVAQVETRRYFGRKVSGAAVEAGQYGANVVTLDMLRGARIVRAREQLRADRAEAVEVDGDGEGAE